jgi:outer membrane receptor protein involved in Fe transport
MGASTAYVGGLVANTGERMTDVSTHTPAGEHQFAGVYTTVDLRTGLLFDKFSVELYAKNVTNERAFTDIIAPGQFAAGAAAVAIIRPRTVGVSLGFKF